jgi:plasmid stabilization system protein ParE
VTKEYTLRYGPLFQDEVASTQDYIAKSLQNPIAADNLVDKVEQAILKRLKDPEIFRVYTSTRGEEYRRISVGNFFVLYVMHGNIMEVRRFVYARRDFDGIGEI